MKIAERKISSTILNEEMEDENKTYMTETIIAISAFDNGPAKAILITSILGFLRLFSLNCTGLAHPNPANINIIKPRGSICFNGFSVILPCSLAVESPHIKATRA